MPFFLRPRSEMSLTAKRAFDKFKLEYIICIPMNLTVIFTEDRGARAEA
jgi:hypothetical protein